MFQGTIIRNEPAFRPRPKTILGYHKFSEGGYDAFVAPDVLKRIVQDARQAAPNETIGYLVGRPFRDAEGPYAVVTDAITATSARRGRATVETTLDDERQLLDRLLAVHPTAEKLGWFHSHPFPMPHYSRTDQENQKFWGEFYHLGLLATLEDESDVVSIHAFRGPDSIRLQPPYTTAAQTVEGFAAPATVFQPLQSGAASGDHTSHRRRHRHGRQQRRRWSRPAAATLAVGVIWSVIYLVGVWLIVQAIKQTPAHAATNVMAARPAAKAAEIESRHVENASLPQSAPAAERIGSTHVSSKTGGAQSTAGFLTEPARRQPVAVLKDATEN